MKYLLIIAVLLLSACTSGQGMPMAQYVQPDATPHNFKLCHGYSCTFRSPVSLEKKDWKSVLALFKSGAKSAKEERVRIVKAVARIENLVSERNGIEPDRARASTVRDGIYQMDCIDETINTDRYLGFLEAAGVFKFHQLVEPLHRGFFVDGVWPHNAAALQVLESGEIYAIDSFYHDNGVKVEAVEKAVWLDNWRPEDGSGSQ